MAKAGSGQTIIVAGGGGAGGSRSGGGGSSGSGGGKSPVSKGGGKLKINDQMFWTIVTALGGLGAVAYIYYSRPDLVHEFVGTITGNKPQAQTQVPAVPAQPSGTVQNDVLPQQTTPNDPYAQQNYPYGPGMGGSQAQFQYPQQQQSPNLQQYQPYQPTSYGNQQQEQQQFSTSFNPAFGQNSNQPTYSFAARRLSKLDFDSQDGMLTKVA